MKFCNTLILVFCLAIVISCSKKSDPAPSLANASVSFGKSGQIVTPPSALVNSQDTHAMEAYGDLTEINSLINYTAAFTAPSGATKTATPIVGVNVGGRVASAQQEYLVYIWSDPTYGSVAYQVSETTDRYTFELFYRATGTTVWVRYLDAEEKKDKSSGFMNIYDPTITKVSPADISYVWTRGTNTLNFVITYFSSEKIIVNYNTQTKAGDIEAYESNILSEKLTWDTLGHGTWTDYDTNGTTVISSGTW